MSYSPHVTRISIGAVIPDTVIEFEVYSWLKFAFGSSTKLKLSACKSAGGVSVYILNTAVLSPTCKFVLFELETLAGDVSLRVILSPLFTLPLVRSLPPSFISKTPPPESTLTLLGALIHDINISREYSVLVFASISSLNEKLFGDVSGARVLIL
jgi:hypothetical protein